jgi:hypothetical protein
MARQPVAGLVAAALALALGGRASASVVTRMDVEDLTRLSAVVAVGTVESVVSARGGRGVIHTDVTVRVEETLKGARAPRVVLRQPGGRVGADQMVAFGMPEFAAGERVLVFAARTRGGALSVTGLFQGKYRVVSEAGVEMAVRDAEDGALVVGRAKASAPARERLDLLRARVRGLAARYPAPAETSAPVDAAAPVEAAAAPAFTLRPLLPLRWFEPDAGLPVVMRYNPAPEPVLPGTTARAEFVASVNAWTNVTGSTIVMQDGGNTSLSCWAADGQNVVSNLDPCGQFVPFDPVTCSGVLAVTGLARLSLETRVVNGATFLRQLESDIVINAGTECFWAEGEGNYGEVLAHEMGHVVGLGHSCGDAFSPDCATNPEADHALMRAFAHGDGRGATPQTGDIDGARFIYPPPAFVDALLNQDTFSAGQTLDLKADLNGTARADLYLLLVVPGGTFYSVGGTGVPNELVPAARDAALGFATDVPLVNSTITGFEPGGVYTWVLGLVTPGANPAVGTNWLAFDVATFTLNP